MKEKIHYVIEAALAVAVIILFVLFFTGNKKSSNPNVAVSAAGNVSDVMSIAYVDIDSLMQQYTYSLDLNEKLAKEYENSNSKLTEQARRLQTEMEDFQRKLDTNSFLSRERAESEHQRILRRQEELEKLRVQYAQDFETLRITMTQDMRNIIIAQLQVYNSNKGLHIIYGKRDESILYANEIYNITAEVIEHLNRHYAATPSLKPKD
jgi:outer membrane protein